MTNIYHAIGIMSGTSLDGVDLVYVEIDAGSNYAYKIISGKTYGYTKEWKEVLKGAFLQSDDSLRALDISYGTYLGRLVLKFIEDFAIETIDFIASHGHTIFHRPEEKFTLQIGCGEVIAKMTGCKVVYDFRTQDVAMGGQGAPLVPIGDQLLFSEYDYCLNLGGFANISYKEEGVRKAFDICPVNVVLNHFANQLGKPYDNKGVLASKGTINVTLLNELNTDSFYNLLYPKSLGFEFIATNVLPLISKYNIEIQDILRTFIEHIAIQVSRVLKNSKTLRMLITGGGVYNDFLVARIRLLSGVTIEVPDKQLIEFKEALIFALLGLLRIENKANCLKSVTGARVDHSSGIVIDV